MLVKCNRCYGSNHLESDCISAQLAGLHGLRPKCRQCHGWGHAQEHCPSSRVRYGVCVCPLCVCVCVVAFSFVNIV